MLFEKHKYKEESNRKFWDNSQNHVKYTYNYHKRAPDFPDLADHHEQDPPAAARLSCNLMPGRVLQDDKCEAYSILAHIEKYKNGSTQ